MDTEMMMIQMEQDFQELAEQYDSAADNELQWALGAPDAEQTRMHTENVAQNREMAKMYRRMAEHALDILNKYGEGVE